MKLSSFSLLLTRISAGLALLIAAIVATKQNEVLGLILFVIAYLILGSDVILNAFQKLFKGKLMGEDFLMSIATVGAFAIGEYPEAVAVMLFYQLGEAVQHRAEANSRRSIQAAMDIRPETATVIRDGKQVIVDPGEVLVGEHIVIAPGERIPLDSFVLNGTSHIDTSALTGEPLPRSVKQGSELISGTVNQEGLLTAQVISLLADSTVVKILKLVEHASENKAEQERFITRFAKVYTPIVVSLALLIAVVPPLVVNGAAFDDWFYRALTFLVVSCPCALVISVPLAFFGGIGGAARQGVLVKGGSYLEQLAAIKTIIFDKTGTLTEGRFSISEFKLLNQDFSENELLRLIAHVESFSAHPIALSLVNSYGGVVDKEALSNLTEHSGNGVSATFESKDIAVGSRSFIMREVQAQNGNTTEHEFAPLNQNTIATYVYVSINGKLSAEIALADRLRSEAADALRSLKDLGIEHTVMLSGDQQVVVDRVSEELGISRAHGDLLPHDKVSYAQEIISEAHTQNQKVAVVGDGINDAPMLALSDVGIAMGAFGSEAAIEASDVVIMSDSLDKLATAIEIGRKTKRIASQNIVFSLVIKIGVIVLATFGFASLFLAILADVGVAVLAILNATRALIVKGDDSRGKLLRGLLSRETGEGIVESSSCSNSESCGCS